MKGREVLHHFAAVAEYINQITASDMGVSILEDDAYLAYVPGKSINLGRKKGDKLTRGSVGERCMREKRRLVVEVTKDKSAYGIPYVACALPVFESNGNVAGCIVTTESTELFDFIRETARELSGSSLALSDAIQNLMEHAEKLNTAGRLMEELSRNTVEKVMETDEVIGFINEVADRTNLLGLNAAIEASRVGDLGKGFGVVADEIRKLADKSAESVKSINTMLHSIQAAIREMAAQSAAVGSNVHEQIEVITGIASSSEELSAMAGELTNRATMANPS